MFNNAKFYIINRSLDHLHVIDVETVVGDDGSALKPPNQQSALCIFIFLRLYSIRASKSTNTLAIMNWGQSSYYFIQYGGQQAARRLFGVWSRKANHFDSSLVMGCIPGHKFNPFCTLPMQHIFFAVYADLCLFVWILKQCHAIYWHWKRGTTSSPWSSLCCFY